MKHNKHFLNRLFIGAGFLLKEINGLLFILTYYIFCIYKYF